MGSRLDHAKVSRQRQVTHYKPPSWRMEPLTTSQRRYIESLWVDKGQTGLNMPKTKGGGADMIDRLLQLPNVQQVEGRPRQLHEVPESAEPSERDLLVAELQEAFPHLSPQTARSYVHLALQVDPIGVYFLMNELTTDQYAYKDQADTVIHLMKAFVGWAA